MATKDNVNRFESTWDSPLNPLCTYRITYSFVRHLSRTVEPKVIFKQKKTNSETKNIKMVFISVNAALTSFKTLLAHESLIADLRKSKKVINLLVIIESRIITAKFIYLTVS